MPLTRLIALPFLMLAIGCSNQTFEVKVANQTDQTLTVGIVKDGPPYEKHLAAPGEWAVDTQLEYLPPWGNPVPPGRTIDSGAISGSFPSGTRCYLRIYRGQHSNAELIAISEPSFDRIDVILFPGLNEIVVEGDPKKGLKAHRAGHAAQFRVLGLDHIVFVRRVLA